MRPFYARKQAPKSSLWLLPTATAPFVVKEYSGARKQVRRRRFLWFGISRTRALGCQQSAWLTLVSQSGCAAHDMRARSCAQP